MTTPLREAPPVAPETLDEARRAVASMLSQSDAFRGLAPETREEIAGNTAAIAAVLAEPAKAKADAAPPDAFEINVDTGGDGAQGPRVTVRDGVDEQAALHKINSTLPLDKPVTSLDDETAEGQLVPAARTQLATSRQQLLATMVLMGINR